MSLVSLIYITRKSLQHERSNAHSNVTKNFALALNTQVQGGPKVYVMRITATAGSVKLLVSLKHKIKALERSNTAHEYAADRGLKHESCDEFDLLAGDAVNPGERPFQGQSQHCSIITTREFQPGKVGCGRSLYPLREANKRISLSDNSFCNCPSSERWYESSGGRRVREWNPSMFQVRMMYRGENHCIVEPIAGKRQETYVVFEPLSLPHTAENHLEHLERQHQHRQT